MKKHGFTLIEVLIVVSILSILVLGALFSVRSQRDKAEDARTKAYLNRLKIAFEDYYNDKNCYPPAEWFDDSSDCGSDSLNPYLSQIQCEKKTGLPYKYETDSTGCKWFKVYATFNRPDTDEQAILQRSSSGSPLGNYGVSSSNVAVTVLYTETASPTPTPTATPTPSIPGATYYYCSSNNNCTGPVPPNLTCDRVWANDANCGGNCVASICH